MKSLKIILFVFIGLQLQACGKFNAGGKAVGFSSLSNTSVQSQNTVDDDYFPTQTKRPLYVTAFGGYPQELNNGHSILFIESTIAEPLLAKKQAGEGLTVTTGFINHQAWMEQ